MPVFEKLTPFSFRLRCLAWMLGVLIATDVAAQAPSCAERFAKDPALSQLFDGSRLKDAGWVRRPDSDTVLVFVHGIFSNNQAAWLNNNEAAGCPYWPKMVANDPAFAKAGVFVASYYSGPASGNFDVKQAANQLLNILSLPHGDDYSPIQYPKLVFVAHSLGGIVTRRLLTSESKAFSRHKLGLVLMASPSRGSAWADRADWIASRLGNKMALQLRPDDPVLTEIHEAFSNLLRANPASLNIQGTEQFENLFFRCEGLWGCTLTSLAPRNIVSETDGGYYFGAPQVVPQTDHSSIVKPARPDDQSHQRLKQFFSTKFAASLRPYKDSGKPGMLSLEGTRPAHGWRTMRSEELRLLVSPDLCSVPAQPGCSVSLPALPPLAAKPALGSRRWVAAGLPAVRTVLGPVGSYSFEEVMQPLQGTEGASSVTVTSTRKNSEVAVAEYVRQFRLEEYAETGRTPYRLAVPLCGTFNCRFEVEVDTDVQLTHMGEDLPLGQYNTPWEPNQPVIGKVVRLVQVKPSATTRSLEFLVIPDFAAR